MALSMLIELIAEVYMWGILLGMRHELILLNSQVHSDTVILKAWFDLEHLGS